MIPQLNNLFKSSDMRFAREARKAELILNRLFNCGNSHNLQNRNKRAGNRGGGESPLTYDKHDLQSCNMRARNRGGGESPLTYDKHDLQSCNMRAGNRGAITPFGCIFLLGILWGCSSPQSSTDLEGARQDDSGVFAIQTICDQDDRCVVDCRELFVGDSSNRLKKCMKQTVADVRALKVVIAAMDRGAWSSIKPNQLQRALEFDSDLWFPYVIGKKSYNRAFLKLVADEPQVAELIDDNEILRQAFMSLVLLGSPDDKVLDGMQEYIDEDENQTFFGVAALKENNEAFAEGHRLLSDVCQKRKLCMQRVYCGIYEDIVFTRLNELNLSSEVTDSSHISVSICN